MVVVARPRPWLGLAVIEWNREHQATLSALHRANQADFGTTVAKQPPHRAKAVVVATAGMQAVLSVGHLALGGYDLVQNAEDRSELRLGDATVQWAERATRGQIAWSLAGMVSASLIAAWTEMLLQLDAGSGADLQPRLSEEPMSWIERTETAFGVSFAPAVRETMAAMESVRRSFASSPAEVPTHVGIAELYATWPQAFLLATTDLLTALDGA